MTIQEAYNPEETIAIDDNPFWDCTEAAHPAWWRGQEYATETICSKINSLTGYTGNDTDLKSTLKRVKAIFNTSSPSSIEFCPGKIPTITKRLSDLDTMSGDVAVADYHTAKYSLLKIGQVWDIHTGGVNNEIRAIITNISNDGNVHLCESDGNCRIITISSWRGLNAVRVFCPILPEIGSYWINLNVPLPTLFAKVYVTKASSSEIYFTNSLCTDSRDGYEKSSLIPEFFVARYTKMPNDKQ